MSKPTPTQKRFLEALVDGQQTVAKFGSEVMGTTPGNVSVATIRACTSRKWVAVKRVDAFSTAYSLTREGALLVSAAIAKTEG